MEYCLYCCSIQLQYSILLYRAICTESLMVIMHHVKGLHLQSKAYIRTSNKDVLVWCSAGVLVWRSTGVLVCRNKGVLVWRSIV